MCESPEIGCLPNWLSTSRRGSLHRGPVRTLRRARDWIRSGYAQPVMGPLTDDGLPTAIIRQGGVTQSSALNELERVIRAGAVIHDGHPVLRLMLRQRRDPHRQRRQPHHPHPRRWSRKDAVEDYSGDCHSGHQGLGVGKDGCQRSQRSLPGRGRRQLSLHKPKIISNSRYAAFTVCQRTKERIRAAAKFGSNTAHKEIGRLV